MSFAVTQPTREIGIRMALGAARGDVIGLMIGRGMLLASFVVSIELAGALAFSRSPGSLRYVVTAGDPVTYVTIACVLSTVALVACAVPAFRATRIDPLAALRYDWGWRASDSTARLSITSWSRRSRRSDCASSGRRTFAKSRPVVMSHAIVTRA
jgi:hypothetical protein